MGGNQLIDLKKRMEQLSVAFVHAIAYYCGYGADSPSVDHDSIDITISSSGRRKVKLDIQLKATTRIINEEKDSFSFQLSLKNYNDLRAETMCPRILLVFCMPEDENEWIKHTIQELSLRKCAYWLSLQGNPETDNKETINVKVSKSNLFSPEELKKIMLKIENGDDI